MGSDERPQTKHYELSDERVRDALSEVFSAEFCHGYFLHEIVRSPQGGWHCIWRRRCESYAADFDWRAARQPDTTGGEHGQ